LYIIYTVSKRFEAVSQRRRQIDAVPGNVAVISTRMRTRVRAAHAQRRADARACVRRGTHTMPSDGQTRRAIHKYRAAIHSRHCVIILFEDVESQQRLAQTR